MSHRQRPADVAKKFIDGHDPPWVQSEFIDDVKGNLASFLYI